MKILTSISLFIIILFSNISFAEDNYEEEKDLYQIKLLMIVHNVSNYIEYNEKFIDDKYQELKFIEIQKNNCLIKSDHTCGKYDFDYKLDTFNDHKKSLESGKDIEVINHVEWIQNIDSEKFIKIKGGYDYSDEVLDNSLDIKDTDILGSGRIKKYEGVLVITKKKFFEININLFEKMIMKSPGFFTEDILTSKKYVISQNIMLNKTTYIDRENFGFIVEINKIK
ncbi:CsiV family protein [Gammaproteobacteria bacterium]|nr:CsiV family protein [Gammaproteobacteria bacterium]